MGLSQSICHIGQSQQALSLESQLCLETSMFGLIIFQIIPILVLYV